MASDTISEYLLTKTVITQKRQLNIFCGFIKDFKGADVFRSVCVSCFKQLYVSVCV